MRFKFRYFLPLILIAVSGHAATYSDLAGTPPAPYKLEFRDWYNTLLAARIDECDDARGTTYYISTATASPAGSSMNNGLSAAAPKLISDVNTLISGSSGNIAILFRADQEYVSTGIDIDNKDSIELGAYGTGRAPLIHTYATSLTSGSDWANATDDRWTYSVASAVGSIREKTNNDARLSPYTYVTSTALVESTPRSWYWASNTLHINAGVGVDPNSIDYELNTTTQANNNGVEITNADKTYVHDLRFDGFGAFPGSIAPCYAVKLTAGLVTDRLLVRDCEGHYCGRHCFGSVEALGPCTWIRCKAGLMMDTTSNTTSFVTYAASLTGVEAIYDNCVTVAGEVPTNSQPGPYYAGWQGFLAHDTSGTTRHSLYILNGCREDAAPWRTNNTVTSGAVTTAGIGSDSDLSTLRTFIIDHRVVRAYDGEPQFTAYQVWINPHYDVVLPVDNDILIGVNPAGGHVYNAIVRYRDTDNDQQRFLITNGNSNTKYHHCNFVFEGTNTGGNSGFISFVINVTGGSPTCFFKNSLFVCPGQKILYNLLANTGQYYTNCAGYNVSEATSEFGFVSTPGWVSLRSPLDGLMTPDGTLLANAGADGTLEYDHNWNRRPLAAPSIGAYEVPLEEDTDSQKIDTLLARLGPFTGDTDKNSAYGALRAIANSAAGFNSDDLTKDDGDGEGDYGNTQAALAAIRAVAALAPLQEDLGAITGGTTSTVVGPAEWSTTDDKYIGCQIVIFNGSAAGDTRIITDYVGSTRTATVEPALSTAPSGGDLVFMLRGVPQLIVPSEKTAIAGAVWDKSRASHVTAGSFGEGVSSVQGNVTGNLGGNVVGNLNGNVAGSVGSVNALANNVLTAAAISNDAGQELADALLDRSNGIETGYTLRGALRLIAAALAGKTNTSTGTTTFRNLTDTKTRITTTISGGNRTQQVLDVTD